MLVFFIHGVGTKNRYYADALITNINKGLAEIQPKTKTQIETYQSYWGHLFNNKKSQINNYLKKDFDLACEKHPQFYKYLHHDIYRYKDRRKQLINDFLGDFLIYQNPGRGITIRRDLLEQLNLFIKDHHEHKQIHFIAHSLGSLILWDLLFSDMLTSDDPAFLFREKLNQLDMVSITTLGSPLLFLKQMLDINFSTLNSFIQKYSKERQIGSYKLTWVNIIHSSDLIAYPLKAATEDEIGSNIFLSDQYVWQDANGREQSLRNLGQTDLAMVIAAEDAHSSYFYDNLDGVITGRIIAYNLLGDTKKLSEKFVHPK